MKYIILLLTSTLMFAEVVDKNVQICLDGEFDRFIIKPALINGEVNICINGNKYTAEKDGKGNVVLEQHDTLCSCD